MDENPNGASTIRRHAAGHLRGLMVEDLRQEAMNRAGVCSPFGLLVLKFVHLSQDLHWDENMVVLEPIQTVRVVQQNIRI